MKLKNLQAYIKPDKFLYFRDDTFTWNKEWTLEFCEKYRLDSGNELLRGDYAIMRFFHDLIKGNGILKNRYFAVGEREKIRKIQNGGIVSLGEDAKARNPSTMLRASKLRTEFKEYNN